MKNNIYLLLKRSENEIRQKLNLKRKMFLKHKKCLVKMRDKNCKTTPLIEEMRKLSFKMMMDNFQEIKVLEEALEIRIAERGEK